MSAHTPGPWNASRNDNGSWSVDNGHGYIVARCPNTGRHAESETTEADARLIAAAPELLEALEKAELHLAAIGTPRDAQGRYHKDGEWTFGEALSRDVDAREVSAAFALIRTAIAKARGEQP